MLRLSFLQSDTLPHNNPSPVSIRDNNLLASRSTANKTFNDAIVYKLVNEHTWKLEKYKPSQKNMNKHTTTMGFF